jgi:hypothetical protein
MEFIAQVVRGDKIDPEEYQCSFCDKKSVAIFGITKSKKHDGTLFSGFGVCKEHNNKLNALLSGEFDIDFIYLKRQEASHKKNFNLRGHPPLSVAETKHKKFWQECSYIGCTNRYYGIKNQKYCNDPRCAEVRKISVKARGRKKLQDPDAKNIILAKSRYNRKLTKGQLLTIRCRATSALKERCPNTFLIVYDPKQNIYPMFCECHRSAYKRQRYGETKCQK